MEYPPRSWDQAYLSVWPPLNLVYQALHGNAVISVSPETVNLYLEIKQNNLSSFFILCLAVWVGLKQGSKNMVLVVLLQIRAKDLTVCMICNKLLNATL